MPLGRPSSYKKEVGDKICEMIATTSLGLRHILAEEGMPNRTTLFRWIENNEAFRNQYAISKQAQADYMVEEIIDIADDGSNDLMTIIKGDIVYEQENKEVTNRSRLRVDARKWIASKLYPKKYGDKLEMNGGLNIQGAVEHKVTFEGYE